MQSLSCKSSLSLCFSALGIWLTRSKIQGKKSNDDAEEERGMMLRGGAEADVAMLYHNRGSFQVTGALMLALTIV